MGDLDSREGERDERALRGPEELLAGMLWGGGGGGGHGRLETAADDPSPVLSPSFLPPSLSSV